mmetsp:Transcript_9083/g.27201  ORF Transcript_9083/g.27201 Transcript_9083/m.27201 type:complete len:264 (-) Transcript_9083:205-996(-)
MKDGVYGSFGIDNLHEIRREYEGLGKGKPTVHDMYVDMTGLAEAGNLTGAMKMLRTTNPQKYCERGSVIRENLKNLVPTYDKSLFAADRFSRELLDLDEKDADGKLRVVVLSGDSNTGKTEFALAHFNCALRVTTLDMFKRLTDAHDGVVVDDPNFKTWNLDINGLKNLLEAGRQRSVKCRHSDAVIMPHHRMIVCTNQTMATLFDVNGTVLFADNVAIQNRVRWIRVREPLFPGPPQPWDDAEAAPGTNSPRGIGFAPRAST